ncbi:9788_t:CDS:1, partial [Gigaspora rosea]
ATALLEDETQESFVWALAMIKRCTNNIMPRVIFTNCDLAMANAIVLEFPNSNHHLCMYHIGVNLKKNLRGKLWSNKFQQFENDFFLCCNTLSTNLFE